jgi:hypothetical protein
MLVGAYPKNIVDELGKRQRTGVVEGEASPMFGQPPNFDRVKLILEPRDREAGPVGSADQVLARTEERNWRSNPLRTVENASAAVSGGAVKETNFARSG